MDIKGQSSQLRALVNHESMQSRVLVWELSMPRVKEIQVQIFHSNVLVHHESTYNAPFT